MWPFATNSKQKNDSSSKSPQQEITELKEWRDVGDTFMYLGQELSVVSHCRLVQGLSIHLIPVLEAEYIDRNGVIRTHEFSLEQAQMLIRLTRTPKGMT